MALRVITHVISLQAQTNLPHLRLFRAIVILNLNNNASDVSLLGVKESDFSPPALHPAAGDARLAFVERAEGKFTFFKCLSIYTCILYSYLIY